MLSQIVCIYMQLNGQEKLHGLDYDRVDFEVSLVPSATSEISAQVQARACHFVM